MDNEFLENLKWLKENPRGSYESLICSLGDETVETMELLGFVESRFEAKSDTLIRTFVSTESFYDYYELVFPEEFEPKLGFVDRILAWDNRRLIKKILRGVEK
jgi:hypothetical protein